MEKIQNRTAAIGNGANFRSVAEMRAQWEVALGEAKSNLGDAHSPASQRKILLGHGDGGISSRDGPGGMRARPGGGDPRDNLPDPLWIDYGSIWSEITNGISGDQGAAVSGLRGSLDAAETLSYYWEELHLDAIDWNGQLGGLPEDVRNAVQFIKQNPALLKAITGADGKITAESVRNFLGRAVADLYQSAKDYGQWRKDNPDAGPMAIEIAQSAAILEANNTLLGGQYDAADLLAFAAQNPGFSSSLTGAAKMWAQPGMFYFIDRAGQNILTTMADGLVNGGNFGSFLTAGLAPSNDDDAINLINAAAMRGAAIGTDTVGLGGDIFVHPENYSAEQKAAVLQELLDAQVLLYMASDGHILDVGTQINDGVNPTFAKTVGDLQSKIELLRADPDVQLLLGQKTPLGIQAIINADPDFKAAVDAAYEHFKSGAMLNDDLNAKDAQGNPLPQPQAIELFISQAGFFQLATGQNGQLGPDLDLMAIAKASGNYDKLVEYFNDNIASADDLRTLLDSDPIGGAAIFEQELLNYASMLDPADAQAGLELQDNINTLLLGSLSFEELDAIIGDGRGSIDDAKLRQLIEELQHQDPSITGSASDPTTMAGQIATAVRNVWSAMRLGTTAAVAWNNLRSGAPITPNIKNPLTYLPRAGQMGILHGVNAILGAAALATSAAAKPPGNPAQIAALTGVATIVFGHMINSAGRVANYLADQKTIAAMAGEIAAAEADLAAKRAQLEGLKGNISWLEKDLIILENDIAIKEANVDIVELKFKVAEADYFGHVTTPESLKAWKIAKKELSAAKSALRGAIEDKIQMQEELRKEKMKLLGIEAEVLYAETQLQRLKGTSGGARVSPTPIAVDGNEGKTPWRGKTPAIGETISGIGGIVSGAAMIFDAKHHSSDNLIQKLSYANGAFSIASGFFDTAEGLFLIFGKTASRFLGTAASWADVLAFSSGLVGAIGAAAGFAFTIAGMVIGLKKEHDSAIAVTRAIDGLLLKYGINGGPITPEDIRGTTALGRPLAEPPSPTKPGNYTPPQVGHNPG